MKIFTKKLLSFIMVLTLILSLSTLLSGCYIIKSGKMNQVEGLYELTSYGGKSNYMEERGTKVVMVIRADGTGWYGYQSNSSEPYISELRCKFTQDTENPGKYSYVEIDFQGNGEYVKFGIQASFNSTSINSSKPVFSGDLFKGTYGLDYYITSNFNRVSKATDLDSLKNYFGDYKLMPSGTMYFDGFYEGFGPVSTTHSFSSQLPSDPFVYIYFDIDLLAGKGRAWYMLKSDEQAVETEFDVSIGNSTSDGFMLTLGSMEEVRAERSSSCYIYLPYDDGFAIQMAYRGDSYTDEEIAKMIDEIYNNYLANKAQ